MGAHRSRSEWLKLVKAFDSSGVRACDFASQRGVNAKTLRWWRAWFRREALTGQTVRLRPPRRTEEADPNIRLVQVVTTAPERSPAPAHCEVPDVTIDIGPARVSIRRGVDVSTLAAVLAALGVKGVR